MKFGVSYLFWGPRSQSFPHDSLAKDLALQEYGGDSLHGLISPPYHRGGNVLYWNGSVEFKR
jgi:hypothetical protein